MNSYGHAALHEAHQRGSSSGLFSIVFVRGCVECFPFRDEVFDAVFSNFGPAHFNDPNRALEEMVRVSKRGGKVGLADYRHPAYKNVHSPFKDLEPSTAVNWIADKLRELHCHSVRIVFLLGDFYAVVGHRSISTASRDVILAQLPRITSKIYGGIAPKL